MGPELVAAREPAGTVVTIRRLTADGTSWRVQVELWQSDGLFRGRFVFRPDRPGLQYGARSGSASLRGRTREEVVGAAHDVPERRLRALLHSLS